ncbi:MAG: FAD-dependent oxidoreductase [Pirellulales bacterium]
MHVLVIGAGVSGLTTALALRRAGHRVTVVAEKFGSQLVSVVAGALWEWPPAVCGYHQDPISLNRSKQWCLASYREFRQLAADAATGVFLRQANFYFKAPLEEQPRDFLKMQELRDNVDGFVRGAAMIRQHGICSAIGVQDAYGYLAPMIDTDAYMAWLRQQVEQAGCSVQQRKISEPLDGCADRLRSEFSADLLVNCTGLGAIDLCGDEMFPLRGALVRVKNRQKIQPPVETAHCLSYSGEGDRQDMVFIVPRGQNMLLLGGLVEPDVWDTAIGLDNYQPIRDMFQRCQQFLPALKEVEIDPQEPVRVGLRPFRAGGIRLEGENSTRTIHNYGHGGSGFTLSWGCAAEVVAIAGRMLGEIESGG